MSRWMLRATLSLATVLSPLLCPVGLPAQAPGAPYRTAWNPTMGSLPAALTVIAPQGEVRIRTGTGKYIAWRVEVPWSKVSQAVQDRAEAAIGTRISPDSGAFFTVSEGLPERAILVLLVPEQIGRLNVTIQRKGRIDVWDFKGEINVSNRRGPIILERTRGTVLADAPDGDIRLTVDSLPPPRSAGIALLGNRGNIAVTLPGRAVATLSLWTDQGAIITDFLTPVSGTPVRSQGTIGGGQRADFALGGAGTVGASTEWTYSATGAQLFTEINGPAIRITTISGNITVTRKR